MPSFPSVLYLNTVYRVENEEEWIDIWAEPCGKSVKYKVRLGFDDNSVLTVRYCEDIGEAKEGVNKEWVKAVGLGYHYKGQRPLIPSKSKSKTKKINLQIKTFANLAIKTPFKMNELPNILEPDIIYRFENTTTRNAFWEIWALGGAESGYQDIWVRYGKLGSKGTSKRTWSDIANESASGLMLDAIESKKHYVYKGSYKMGTIWDTKATNKPKQKDPIKEPKAIDTAQVAKNMFRRTIKFQES